jgi:hypothetical protein
MRRFVPGCLLDNFAKSIGGGGWTLAHCRPFGAVVLRLRELAGLLPALERRRIAYPKASAAICYRRNGVGVRLRGSNPEPLMSALGS